MMRPFGCVTCDSFDWYEPVGAQDDAEPLCMGCDKPVSECDCDAL